MECTERKKKRAGGLRGSAVVEMSYIIPLFLGLFVLIVHTVFYYHDKAVMNAAAQRQRSWAPRRRGGRGRTMTWKPSSGTGRTGS